MTTKPFLRVSAPGNVHSPQRAALAKASAPFSNHQTLYSVGPGARIGYMEGKAAFDLPVLATRDIWNLATPSSVQACRSPALFCPVDSLLEGYFGNSEAGKKGRDVVLPMFGEILVICEACRQGLSTSRQPDSPAQLPAPPSNSSGRHPRPAHVGLLRNVVIP
ncbi:uncharacterized protein BCR38DRAFT_221394 [Pseudomassariella vexata]|uniref:Uncharacterized protein n=1 Tax=Pseudomassariella vexata TaxID=1141098 RepID=A0A1Y2DV26_9PEZI|nr:uncharacterized protein BCR38DRAFT_221394 [Pseudomassariella vexata]ORY63097.1 hypothetical protein BCR38DRAFT_221394 [Pseudomassariella vexata]